MQENLNNNNLINIKKNNNRNFIGVLKKNNNKYKHKTLKNSLNETDINSILFSYSNSYKNKNKFIKIIQAKKNQNLILSNFINKKKEEKNNAKKIKNCTMSEINCRHKNKKKISTYTNPVSTKNNNLEINSVFINNFNSSVNNIWNSKSKSRNNDNTSLNELKTIVTTHDEKKYTNYNFVQTPNMKKKLEVKIYNSMKKDKNKKLVSNKSINNKNTKYYNIEVNIDNTYNKSNNNNYEKIPNNKGNQKLNKQHVKLNSTQFSTGNLNINFNNYTNNYCVNYNNSIVTTNTNMNKDKYSHIQSKNYKFKRIKNIKNNIKDIKINKIDKLILNTNKNYNFFPLALTDRNKRINIFSPINNYSINAPNKNKK